MLAAMGVRRVRFLCSVLGVVDAVCSELRHKEKVRDVKGEQAGVETGCVAGDASELVLSRGGSFAPLFGQCHLHRTDGSK